MFKLLVGIGLGCAVAPLLNLYRNSKKSQMILPDRSQVVQVGTPGPFIQFSPKLVIVTKIDVPVRSRNGSLEVEAGEPAQVDEAEKIEKKALEMKSESAVNTAPELDSDQADEASPSEDSADKPGEALPLHPANRKPKNKSTRTRKRAS